MAVRSKRLVLRASIAGQQVVYQVPPGETALVKTVVVRNSTGAAIGQNLAIRASGTGTDFSFLNDSPAGATILRYDLWLVLHPGDELRWTALAVGLQLQVHGTELEGVAD